MDNSDAKLEVDLVIKPASEIEKTEEPEATPTFKPNREQRRARAKQLKKEQTKARLRGVR